MTTLDAQIIRAFAFIGAIAVVVFLASMAPVAADRWGRVEALSVEVIR